MTRCAITGAADGIGRALALRFASAGAAIVGIDKDAEKSARTRQDIERAGVPVDFIHADLATEAGVAHALETLRAQPAIDTLIHNAGINAVGRFPDLDPLRQRAVIDLNLTAPMILTASLLKAGKLPPGASVVFISSLAHYTGYPGAAAYAAGKSGLASYARSLSVACPDLHILTVFPGPTRTAHARRYSPDNAREHRRMPPGDLADRIYRAVRSRKPILIPGLSNRLAAAFGLHIPRLTEWLMRRTILDRLTAPRP